MRVLITGVNPVQCGHVPKMAYISFVIAVNRLAVQSGWTVDIRPVTVGEDLSGYDKIIAFMAPLRGFVAKHALGLLWTLHSVPQKLVLSFDDWQVTGAVGSADSLLKGWDKVMGSNQFGYAGYEESKPHWPVLKALLAELASTAAWPYPVLVPAYSGGDLSLLGIPAKPGQVKSINPSALFKGRYGWAEPSDLDESVKSASWVMATLHNHQSWLKKQKLAWPVVQLGSRSLEQPRLKESEVFHQHYMTQRGALSPAYDNRGSGWWRARFGFAADALCVIAGDPAESAMLGLEYSCTPREVEGLPLEELKKLALMQRDRYYFAAGSEECLLGEFQSAVCTP